MQLEIFIKGSTHPLQQSAKKRNTVLSSFGKSGAGAEVRSSRDVFKLMCEAKGRTCKTVTKPFKTAFE